MKRTSRERQEATEPKRRNISASQNSLRNISNLNGTQQCDPSIRSGKILRIHLTNFMCHANIVVDFNRRVNLLVGNNGSGKSAILTALIIGLGSKARSTNRSSSIKQFIKTGETAATIEIDIANDGIDTYDRETYGNKITVVRQITDKGSSSYKIKDEHGHIISKKTDELHRLLLYFNIQTDNPVFVLNQDSARNFLKEMNPSKNYDLFLKATQIETILKKLNECLVMHKNYEQRMQVQNMQNELLRKQVADLGDKYKRLLSFEDMKATIRRYNIEMLWVRVRNQEKLTEELKAKIKQTLLDKEKLVKRVRESEQGDSKIREQIKCLEEELAVKNQSISDENEKLEEFYREYVRANERYETEQRHLNKMENKIKQLQEDVAQLESAIAERSGDYTARINRMKEENQQKIVDLRQQIESIEAVIQNAERELQMQYGNRKNLQEQCESIKRKQNEMRTQISYLKADMERLAGSAKNNIALYGRDMAVFLQAVQKAYKAGQFEAMPRGPVGMFIQVPEDKWRSTVEFLLGGILHLFLVNTAKDRVVLDNIARKFEGIRVTILTTKFQHSVYNIKKGMVKPPKGTYLLLDVIKCSDPVITNCLIDRVRAEKILLTEDQRLAIHISSHQENVPQNLFRVILKQPSIDYRPAPMYRAYSIKIRAPRFIQFDISERKKEWQAEIDQNNAITNEYESKLRKMSAEITEIDVALHKTKEHRDKCFNKNNVKKEQLQELLSIEYPTENEVEILKKELCERQEKIKAAVIDLESKKENCKKYRKRKNEKEIEYSNYKNQVQNIEHDINRIDSQCKDLRVKLHAMRNDTKHFTEITSKIDEAVAEMERDVEDLQAGLNQLRKKAGKAGLRVQSDKTEEELQHGIKRLQRKVDTILSGTETIEEVKALLEEKRVTLKKCECVTEKIKKTLELLTKSRVQRFKAITSLKKHMALRVKYTFDSVLKLRGYTGEISINHNEQKLTMSVIPRDNHISGAVSTTKALSGGERSYSTVALLLSLWSCVDHPFYFLDEYDVFTDQINRQIMTRLLLSEADKKPHRQYVFLTPQDMSFLHATDSVKIHKLSNPRS